MFVAPLYPAGAVAVVWLTLGLTLPWNLNKGLGIMMELTNVTASLVFVISLFIQAGGLPDLEGVQTSVLVAFMLSMVLAWSVIPESISSGIFGFVTLVSYWVLLLASWPDAFKTFFDVAMVLSLITIVMFWTGLTISEFTVSQSDAERRRGRHGGRRRARSGVVTDQPETDLFAIFGEASKFGLHGVINSACAFLWFNTPDNLRIGVPWTSFYATAVVAALWLSVATLWFFAERASKLDLILLLIEAHDAGEPDLFFQRDDAQDILDTARDASVFTYSFGIPLRLNRDEFRATLTFENDPVADEFVAVMDPTQGTAEELFDWARANTDDFIRFYTAQSGFSPYSFLRPNPDQTGVRAYLNVAASGVALFVFIAFVAATINALLSTL